jgi:hypothetical protein
MKNKKALQKNAKGLEMVWLPRQNDFRTFCMREETEKLYRKLEEIIFV